MVRLVPWYGYTTMIKAKKKKTVYANPWMTVREDQVEFPDGREGVFGVVDKPHFALIIPFDGTFLYLVKQYRYPIGQYSLEFPQGSHEIGPKMDASELAAAELKEETGCTAGKITELGFLYEAPGFSTQGYYIYLATELCEGEQQLEDSEQGMEVVKVTINQFWQMVTTASITDSPTIAAMGLWQQTVL